MSFPSYEHYKDSGLEWLGEVPEHWEIVRLKNVAIINMGQSPNSQDCNQEEDGTPFLQGNADFGDICPSPRHYCSVANKFAKVDDILFSVRAPVGAINVADQVYGIGRGLCAITPNANTSQRYLLHKLEIIKCELFSVATGSTYEAVSVEQIGNAKCLFPPRKEQIAITSFLDRETAKIDVLIAEQQRLIELLKEKRQAVISHAVTKGLNPDAPMKDSGIEWLGEVPEHWEVKRLKFLLSDIKAGPFGSSLTKDMYASSGYRVYGQEQVIPNDFTMGDYYISEDKYQELKQYQVVAGDILISCVGTFGKIAIVPHEIEPGIINPRLIRLRCSQVINNEYLVALLRSLIVFEQLSLLSRGGTMDVINIGTLNEVILPVPDIRDQESILYFLDRETAKLDALTTEAQTAIALLQERRIALISAAVTGKIDVRGFTSDSAH